MSFYFPEGEPYRKGLTDQSSADSIAWAYLQAMYHYQDEIGVFYMFEPNRVDIPKTVQITNRLSRLKLAQRTTQEFGTKNTLMKITEEGNYVADRFSSLVDYERYLAEEENKKRPNSGIIIGGSVSGSQIGQESSFGPLRETPTNMPTKNEIRQANMDTTKWKEIIITGVISLIVGLIIVYVEHNTDWFK